MKTHVPGQATRTRLLGVDGARGLALLGMMAVHIIPAIDANGDLSPSHLVASGRAAALFAVLAGVGLALATGGPAAPRGPTLTKAAAGVAGRAFVIFAIGLILGAFNSGVAVILSYYGLLFLVAIPFLGLRSRVLLPLAAVCAVVTPVISHLVRVDMPLASYANPNVASLGAPGELLRELFLTGYYPVLPWTAYLLVGLGVGRLALGSSRVAATVLATGVVIAVSTWMASWIIVHEGGLRHLVDAGLGGHPANRDFAEGVLTTSFYGTTPTTSWWWLTVVSPHTSTPFDLLHTAGTALVVLGLMLLLARRLHYVMLPLSAIGSMTLTLYSLHVILLATLIPADSGHAYVVHIVIAFAIAIPWRTFIGRGPLETLAATAAQRTRELGSTRNT